MAHILVSVDLLQTLRAPLRLENKQRTDLNERKPKEPIKVKEKQKELT